RTGRRNGDDLMAETRRCGAWPVSEDWVRWTLWAPNATTAELLLLADGGRRCCHPMNAEAGGYFTAERAGGPAGRRDFFRRAGGPERAAPASRWQPDGVAGPSAVVRTERFRWSDGDWRGVNREDLVFYEVHVGAFTPEGTFEAVIPRLPELRSLGVTALEV